MAMIYSLVLLSSLELLTWARPGSQKLGPEIRTTNDNGVLPNYLLNATSTGPLAQDCEEYCTLSYPPHTYPEPCNFLACGSGCRAAQLDALIAWPAKPDLKMCTQGCSNVFCTEEQQFACRTGCKTPTLDSVFSNRAHLYQGLLQDDSRDGLEEEEEMGSFIGVMLAAVMSLDLFSSSEFDNLDQHAVDMEIVILPYRNYDITILSDDGVDSVHRLSISGDPLLTGSEQESGAVNSQWFMYSRTSQGCLWFRHTTVFTNVLMLLSGSLTIVGLVLCCTSSVNKNQRTGQLKNTLSPQGIQHLTSSKKAPYELGSEFIQPVLFGMPNYGKVTNI